MFAKLRVRELEDGHRSQRHHVKARKRNHSYPLHGNLPPSFIETALFCAVVDFAVSSDRLVGNRFRQLRTYQCLEPSAHRLRPVVKIRARHYRLRWRFERAAISKWAEFKRIEARVSSSET